MTLFEFWLEDSDSNLVYVWARDEDRAIELFEQQYPGVEVLLIEHLFTDDYSEFITKASTIGFGVGRELS